MDEYVDVMVHGPSQKNISRSGLVAVPENYVHMGVETWESQSCESRNRQMAEAIVSVTVQKLGEFLLEEPLFLFGIGDQAESKKGKGIKKVFRRLSCIMSEAVSLHSVGSEIREITTRLTKIAASMKDYGIKEAMDGESLSLFDSLREQRQSFPYAVEHNLVGLEQSLEKLVNDLVSGECRRRHVWQEILLNLSYKDENQRILSLRDEQLGEELHRFLKRTKCLVVLDDIWGTDAWDGLKHVFPHETGSNIVLTTRNKEVALYADPRGVLHEPRLLTHEESWELLEKISLQGRDNLVEDIGQDYLEELVKRSIVMVGKRDIVTSEVMTCRMHDLMREVCLQKAEQESFVQVVDSRQQEEDEALRSLLTNTSRRISVQIHGGAEEHRIERLYMSSQCRSLVYLMKNQGSQWTLLGKVSFRKMKLLRVLDLEGAQIKGGKLPDDVGDLIHLRNFSLRLTNVKELTSCIGNLTLMITLDLFVKGRLYIPDVIWKLKRLRHLCMPSELDPRTKLDLSTLRNLQQLWDFPVGQCNPRDLLAMTSLRRLSINLSSQNTDFEVVSSLSRVLKRLRGLTINVPCEPMPPPVDITQLVSAFTNLSELELFLKLEKLPGEQSFSSDLGALRLWQCGLVDDPFLVLEKLPNLKILQLFEGSFVGSELHCSVNGFPQLHSLTLSQLENLEEWTVEDGAMIRLVSLELKCCKKLKSVPEGTRFLKNLQEVEIGNMTKAFKDKLASGEFSPFRWKIGKNLLNYSENVLRTQHLILGMYSIVASSITRILPIVDVHCFVTKLHKKIHDQKEHGRKCERDGVGDG
ncbi:hypothetical protein YC2023_093724 [Brassica napus]